MDTATDVYVSEEAAPAYACPVVQPHVALPFVGGNHDTLVSTFNLTNNNA